MCVCVCVCVCVNIHILWSYKMASDHDQQMPRCDTVYFASSSLKKSF